MQLTLVTDAIDSQAWIEPLARELQGAVRGAYRSGGAAGQQVKNFLHGTWLGHPLHSVLTDVPIGAWTAALILDLAESSTGREALGAGADVAVAVGAASAASAALAGLTDWSDTSGIRGRLGLVHGGLNTLALLLYLVSLAGRRRGHRRLGRGLAYVGYGTMAAAGYLGGEMVFALQTGVDHAAGQPLPDKFVPVVAETELTDGRPRRVEADGTPVVLVRQGGRVHALADTCAHLGCSLAEGEVEDASIRCACHGSRYALADGRVLDGPSTFDQPVLEVRVRDGRIEVRKPRRPG